MNAQVKAYTDAKNARAAIVRKNAGLRMAGKGNLALPLPELPPKPVKYLLETHAGDYMGIEWNEERARDYAEENGWKLTILPYDQTP